MKDDTTGKTSKASKAKRGTDWRKLRQMSDAEIHAMIDSLGDVGAALTQAKPTSLSRLYQQLRLQLRYDPQGQAVLVTAQPRVDSARVRGGT